MEVLKLEAWEVSGLGDETSNDRSLCDVFHPILPETPAGKTYSGCQRDDRVSSLKTHHHSSVMFVRFSGVPQSAPRQSLGKTTRLIAVVFPVWVGMIQHFAYQVQTNSYN